MKRSLVAFLAFAIAITTSIQVAPVATSSPQSSAAANEVCSQLGPLSNFVLFGGGRTVHNRINRTWGSGNNGKTQLNLYYSQNTNHFDIQTTRIGRAPSGARVGDSYFYPTINFPNAVKVNSQVAVSADNWYRHFWRGESTSFEPFGNHPEVIRNDERILRRGQNSLEKFGVCDVDAIGHKRYNIYIYEQGQDARINEDAPYGDYYARIRWRRSASVPAGTWWKLSPSGVSPGANDFTDLTCYDQKTAAGGGRQIVCFKQSPEFMARYQLASRLPGGRLLG